MYFNVIMQHCLTNPGQAYHDVFSNDPVHVDKYFAPIPGINGPDDDPDGDTILSMEMTRELNLVPVSSSAGVH